MASEEWSGLVRFFAHPAQLKFSQFIKSLLYTDESPGTYPKWVSVPASAAAAGTVGELASDSSYLYYCYATDTWGRIAKDAW